ncbi:MAG: hypothetical protein IJ410_01350 [Oscillospiraceae bacterium]|nr:hypothetical protein [Oscillospiraceae bacterium]
MDAKKKAEKTEQAVARLSKPYKMWMIFPVWIAANLVMTPFFGNRPFTEMLQLTLNPVALTMTAVMIVFGIKFDKDSRRLYQALCAPTDNLNIDYVKKLDYIRTKTGFSIILVCIAAWVIALMYTNRLANTDTACFLTGIETWWFIKDGDYVIEKLEDDIVSEKSNI